MFKRLFYSFLLFLGFSSSTFAADESKTRVSFRGIGEALSDKNIGSVYRTSRLSGFIGLSQVVYPNISLDIEGGFLRLDGNDGDTALQLIPLTIGGSYLFGSDNNVEPFVGLGCAVVNFMEEIPNSSISGTKLGLDLRAGVRIGTRLIRTRQGFGDYPSTPIGPKQLDVELMLGQRMHHTFGVGSGFDLGATRFGLGLHLRL